MSDPLIALARNIRVRRKALNLTQEAAGDRAHMDMSYWGRIERGTIEPGVRTLARIAAALEMTPAELLVENPRG
jgi:transcriptional regulator with XRE-family HTH domain